MGVILSINVAVAVLALITLVKVVKLEQKFNVPKKECKYKKRKTSEDKVQRSTTSKSIKKYWASMTPEERSKEIKRRRIVSQNNKLVEKKGTKPVKRKRKSDGWIKRRRSKGVKASWDKLTPEQRKIRIDKMQRGRELKKLLKDKGNSFHS